MVTQEERIFDGYGYVASTVTNVVSTLKRYRYSFMPEKEFRDLVERSTDPYETDRICLTEILERAHLAATTSLVRADRWIRGIYLSDDANNYILFTAAFRGLLESCADAHYALATVPRTLAEHAEKMFEALNLVPRSNSYMFQKLEDRLIHFSHGRRVRKEELAPDSHSALHMRDYINYLQDSDAGPIHGFYSELCEVTHPAHDSVWCMLPKLDDSSWQLDVTFDRSLIGSLCLRHREAIAQFFPRGVAPSLMILGLINHMGLEHLKTPEMDHVDLSLIGRYQEFRAKIASAFVLH
ncbi:MAG: hypothetical protein JO314_07610 [Acidobacteria bacterium]|nr:hypothetical protein [Acidobacteriota bacterium]